MIKRINFVWVNDSPPPPWVKTNIDRFRSLNPEYEIILRSGNAQELEHYIHADLLEKWRATDKIEPFRQMVTKGDLLKISIANTFGGWSMDVDTWPFYSMSKLKNIFKIGRKIGGTFSICMFYTEPGWNGWNKLLKIVSNTNADIWCSYTHAYWDYVKMWQNKNRSHDVRNPDDVLLDIFKHPSSLVYQRLINRRIFGRSRYFDMNNTVEDGYIKEKFVGRVDMSNKYFVTGHQNIATLPETNEFLSPRFVLS